MTEHFILQYIPGRIRQLGYRKYHIRYKDITISAYSKQVLTAYNELYFVVDDPKGIWLESDYGVYDGIDESAASNMHEHRGEITIENPGNERRRIKLIQVIIVN
jgi:hypothetical protein